MKMVFFIGIFLTPFLHSAEVSFTMDDPEVNESPLFSIEERNQRILSAFSTHKVKGALFTCGMRIDNPIGKKLLSSWDSAGHMIANHSYSHLYFPSKNLTLDDFKNDFFKVEPLIKGFKNFAKLFRFPYLKEGNNLEKREGMRLVLEKSGYSQGYVTIDASDWYVDSRLRARLKENPNSDLSGYRNYYLKHIWDRSQYYDDLAKKVFGKEVKHTLLIHHNLLNALFLDDLMKMYKEKGWKLISANEAFQDPVYKLQPQILPAGESIIWAAAKETGKFDHFLRYPAEDGQYEKDNMDKLGL